MMSIDTRVRVLENGTGTKLWDTEMRELMRLKVSLVLVKAEEKSSVAVQKKR